MSEGVSETTEIKSFPESVVRDLRDENAALRIENRNSKSHVLQKGYLAGKYNLYNSDLDFHINKFPHGGPENFSVSRAAMAKGMENGRMSGRAWDIWAPWEKQYIHAWEEIRAKAQGDQITGQDGGFLAPEDWNSQFFMVLHSHTVLDQLPVVHVKVPLRVTHMPKVTNEITVSYVGENAAPSATQYKFGQSTYNARKSIAEIDISNEMIRDGGEMADAFLRQAAGESIAVDRDAKLLLGPDGSITGAAGMAAGSYPRGLVGMTFDGSVAKYYAKGTATTAIDATPSHGTPSFLHVSQLRSKVTSLNASANVTAGQGRCTGIIANARFEQTVHVLASAASAWTDAQGRPLWLGGLNGDGTTFGGGWAADSIRGGLMGLNWALTNIMPITSTDGTGTTSSYMIAGNWERYVLYECLTPTFDSTNLSGTSSRGFAADETQIRVTYRYDGGPAQPEAFAVLAGCDQ